MLRYKEKRTASGLEVRFLRLFESLRLTKKRFQFQSGGVSMVTRILGFPIHRKWFDQSYIYGFGYAVDGHGHSQMLQFNYAGEGQIMLANHVGKEGKEEVAAFLRHLDQEGFHYNTAWDRPPRRSGVIVV
jgi:hypothetical protein